MYGCDVTVIHLFAPKERIFHAVYVSEGGHPISDTMKRATNCRFNQTLTRVGRPAESTSRSNTHFCFMLLMPKHKPFPAYFS